VSADARGPLRSADDALFGGYGPFVALVALLLAMALLAPTIAPERDVTTRPGPAPAAQDRRSSGTGGVPQERRADAAPGAALVNGAGR